MSNLITINAIQRRMSKDVPLGKLDESTVRRMWWAALDTLQDEILVNIDLRGGIWIASPLPALYDSNLLKYLNGWVWSPDALEKLKLPNFGLLPPSRVQSINKNNQGDSSTFNRLSLRKEDGNDPFFMIITSEFQIAIALHGHQGQRNLLIRNDYETLQDVLKMLFLRLDQEELAEAFELKESLQALLPLKNNRQVSEIFWPLVSEKLAVFSPSLNIQTLPDKLNSESISEGREVQISLLEAITHEVRTPLATIRTLIRSLLRRNDIAKEVFNRLKQIDSECTEQIDRFGLIFKAAELERKQSKKSGLARTDLGNMLQTMYPVWKNQLERRGLRLLLEVAPDLPHVLSDPEQLELMLGGLIDRNSRGLQSGESLFLELTPAGQRLKLQIFAKSPSAQCDKTSPNNINSDLGAVLSWDPDTGSLQLSQAATQRLLASLGGRLINRKQKGLTVFFPIADSR